MKLSGQNIFNRYDRRFNSGTKDSNPNMKTTDHSYELESEDDLVARFAGLETVYEAQEDGVSVMEDSTAMHRILSTNLWSSSEKKVFKGLKALTKLCDDKTSDSRYELALLGGHLAVLASMQAFPTSAKVQLQGLKLLLRLVHSFNAHWIDVLGSMGAIAVVVKALQSTSSTPEEDAPALQSRAIRLLARLLSSESNADRFLRDGLPLLQEQQVQLCIEGKKGQAQMRRLWHQLAKWEDVQMPGPAKKAVRPIKSKWVDPAEHDAACGGGGSSSFSTLTTVCESDSERDDSHHSDDRVPCSPTLQTGRGSIPRSPERRVTFAPSPTVVPQYNLCDSISEMSQSSSSDASLDHQDQEPGVGWDDHHDDDETFVREVTFGLAVSDDPNEALRRIRDALKESRERFGRKFLEVGGPWALGRALSQHVSDKNVQLRGYDVVHQLVKLGGVAELLGEAQLIPAVLGGLKAHHFSETVREDACYALLDLVLRSDNNADRFVEVGGVAILLRIAGRYVDHDALQFRVCTLLRRIACHGASSRNKAAVLWEGGVAHAARVLSRWGGPVEVATEGTARCPDGPACEAARRLRDALLSPSP